MKVDHLQPHFEQPPMLGIIAGGGNLPKQVIGACQKSGRPYYVLGIENQTNPEILLDVPHGWVRPGAVGRGFTLLRENKVEEVVMVGYYSRPSWSELRPDFIGAQWLAKFVTKIGKDDGILRLVIQEFEKEGFRIIGVEDIIGTEIMAKEGVFGKHTPADTDWVSINRGLEVLHVLGKVDVGQSIVVQEGCVVGIEGMEGTDELMRRCQGLHPAGKGGVLVKIAKPRQDRRVDLPVVGERTIRVAIEEGIEGIAIQAGGVILLDQEKVIALADKAGLFIVGV